MTDSLTGEHPTMTPTAATDTAGEQAPMPRVVLQIRSSMPNRMALEVAVCVARAFHAELESLFIEDEKLLTLANLPFAQEISFPGYRLRPLVPVDMERELALAAASVRRLMETMARAAEVMLNFEIMRTRPERSLSAHCPAGSIVALAEPFAPAQIAVIRRLFERVPGISGIVLVGSAVRRRPGPVVLVVEEVGRLPTMLAMAERLSGMAGEPGGAHIIALLIGDDDARTREMVERARALLGARRGVEIALAQAVRGEAAVIAEALRRLKGSFTLAHRGGLLVPGEGDLRALALALETPLLLMR